MIKPKEITKSPAGGIRIIWDASHVSDYDSFELRFACPCAHCVNEVTNVKMITAEEIPKDIAPKGVQVVGNYAVQIFWNDNHSSGIYTFEYLFKMCSCPTCKQKNGQGEN